MSDNNESPEPKAESKKKSKNSELENALIILAKAQKETNDSLRSSLTAMGEDIVELKKILVDAGRQAAEAQAQNQNQQFANTGKRTVLDIDAQTGERRTPQNFRGGRGGQQPQGMNMLNNIDPNVLVGLAELYRAMKGGGNDLYAQVGKRVILEGVMNQSYNIRATNRLLLNNKLLKQEEVNEMDKTSDMLWKPVRDTLMKGDQNQQ